MTGRKRLLLGLPGLVGGWLLFRWAGERSQLDAIIALVASVGGAAVLVGGLSRVARLAVGVLAGVGALVGARALHEDLRGEHRDEGRDPLVRVEGVADRIDDAWVLDTAPLRVRSMGPRPVLELAPTMAGRDVVWENGPPGAPARTRPWTFAVWSDARGGADVFEKVRAEIRARRVAFSVGVGDLVGMARAYQFEILREQMAGTASPAFFVPGNHDVDPFGTLRPYARVLGPPRWSFVEDGVLFVGLDTSSGHLGDADVRWAEVQEGRAPRSAPLVLFSHYPLFPPSGRPDKALPQSEEPTKRMQALAQRRRAYCFSGSYHAYDRVEAGGAIQVVSGGAGSKLESDGGHHFLVVTVAADGLSVSKVDIPSRSDPTTARRLVFLAETSWASRSMPWRFALLWMFATVSVGAIGCAALGGAGPKAPPKATLAELRAADA